MPEAIITYFAREAKVCCDGKCWKAWGRNLRPRVQLSEVEDDYAFLGDDELGIAPSEPGTYEGADAKPLSVDYFPNRWCVRQCERSAISEPGKSSDRLNPPVFITRVRNMPEPVK